MSAHDLFCQSKNVSLHVHWMLQIREAATRAYEHLSGRYAEQI
jgi:transposase